MATNENGNLLDSAGNVAVDFVWGNLPLQPNDVREENGGSLLVATLDNHKIAYEGWNGYPQYSRPGLAGAEGSGYIVVPSVIGQTKVNARDILEDAGLTVTDGTAATNASKSITLVTRTAGSTEVSITATGAVAAYPVGSKITVASTGTVDGTWTVTGNSSTNVVKFTSNASTVLTSGTGSVIGVADTIKTQTVAAGADSIAVGAAIEIVAYAVAS
jgi:hypothetical protein